MPFRLLPASAIMICIHNPGDGRVLLSSQYQQQTTSQGFSRLA